MSHDELGWRRFITQLEKQRWGNLYIFGEGCTVQKSNDGFRIVVPKPEAQGFWVKLGIEDIGYDDPENDNPGVYSGKQQISLGSDSLSTKFEDLEGGVQSYYDDSGDLVFPMVEANNTTGIGIDPSTGDRFHDEEGNTVETYVWCRPLWQQSGDIVFGFQWGEVQPLVPAFAFFELDEDRDPGVGQFLVRFVSGFPTDQNTPLSFDADGNPTDENGDNADESGLPQAHCVAGVFDYFYVVDDFEKGPIFKRAIKGCKGLAIFNDADQTWEIIRCQQRCVFASASINMPDSGSPSFDNTGDGDTWGGMDGSIAEDNVTITGFTSEDQGVAPDPVPTTATNIYGLRAKDQDLVLLMWQEDAELWLVLQCTLQQSKIIENIKFSTDDPPKIIKTWRKIAVYSNGDAQDNDLFTTKKECT